MLILFQGNTYLYQRMPNKVTEYFLFLNTPGVISGLFLCRLLAREGLRFQESIIFNNRASYISKRKISIIANGEKENCNYILLFLSLPDILLKSIKVVSKSARKKRVLPLHLWCTTIK